VPPRTPVLSHAHNVARPRLRPTAFLGGSVAHVNASDDTIHVPAGWCAGYRPSPRRHARCMRPARTCHLTRVKATTQAAGRASQCKPHCGCCALWLLRTGFHKLLRSHHRLLRVLTGYCALARASLPPARGGRLASAHRRRPPHVYTLCICALPPHAHRCTCTAAAHALPPHVHMRSAAACAHAFCRRTCTCALPPLAQPRGCELRAEIASAAQREKSPEAPSDLLSPGMQIGARCELEWRPAARPAELSRSVPPVG